MSAGVRRTVFNFAISISPFNLAGGFLVSAGGGQLRVPIRHEPEDQGTNRRAWPRATGAAAPRLLDVDETAVLPSHDLH